MIRAARAGATDSAAAAAAQAVVDGGGGAVDAVIAGFFAAAGAEPGVLFAPAVALVAGFGAGARAFDGRAAQPGRGAARPRGFVEDGDVREGAYVAAPRSIAMLFLLSSYRGKATLAELARPGIGAAESAGAKARARLLRQVGSSGVLALRAPEVQKALLDAGGPVAGGALSHADLEDTTPNEAEAASVALGEGVTVHSPPFPTAAGESEGIVACDGRGVIAALAFAPARDGIVVPSLEVSLPRCAVPVRRGVTRVAPGTLLPAPAPIAIGLQPSGLAIAIALSGVARVDPADLGWIAGTAPMESALAELRERTRARTAVAVLTDGKTARSSRVDASG